MPGYLDQRNRNPKPSSRLPVPTSSSAKSSGFVNAFLTQDSRYRSRVSQASVSSTKCRGLNRRFE
jgi:hypothetical protein